MPAGPVPAARSGPGPAPSGLKGVLRDTGTTMLAEVAVLGGGLILYALAARYFGPIGVGEVALVKRGSGLLQPLAFLGLQTGLPYVIARARGQEGPRAAGIAAGSLALAVMSLAVCLPLLLAPGPAARLLIGDGHLGFLMPALCLTLVSIVTYGAIRGIYFGLLRISRANVIQALAVGAGPVAAVIAVHPSPSAALLAAAAATIVLAAAGFVQVLVQAARGVRRSELVPAGRLLVTYSIPRMPGDIAMAALLSAGVLIAAHISDLRAVGFLSISQSLLSAITAAFIPLSVVLLPRATALIAEGRIDAVKSRCGALVAITLGASLFLAGQVAVFADTVLYFWLGPAFTDGAAVLRAVLVSVPFLALFFSLRGLVDAATARPIHTYNLFVTLAITAAGYALVVTLLPRSTTTLGIALSGSVAYGVLSLLTLRAAARLYDLRFAARDVILPVALNVPALAIGYALHLAVGGRTPLEAGLVLVVELALGAMAVGPLVWPMRSVLARRSA